MPNGQMNPLTAPLSTVKQIGEQASAAIQSLGTGMTRAASQTLDAVAGAFPPLPGMPGAASKASGFPAPQQLLPANLQQALGQVENLLIPPGLPRPTQILGQAAPPTRQPPAEQPATNHTPVNTGAMASRRQVAERRGL